MSESIATQSNDNLTEVIKENFNDMIENSALPELLIQADI